VAPKQLTLEIQDLIRQEFDMHFSSFDVLANMKQVDQEVTDPTAKLKLCNFVFFMNYLQYPDSKSNIQAIQKMITRFHSIHSIIQSKDYVIKTESQQVMPYQMKQEKQEDYKDRKTFTSFIKKEEESIYEAPPRFVNLNGVVGDANNSLIPFAGYQHVKIFIPAHKMVGLDRKKETKESVCKVLKELALQTSAFACHVEIHKLQHNFAFVIGLVRVFSEFDRYKKEVFRYVKE